MLKTRMVMMLTIIGTVGLLSACQPQKKQENKLEESAASAAEAEQPRIILDGRAEPLRLQLPECSGKNCPDFAVERLHSNQFVLDELIDQAIVTQLQQSLGEEESTKPNASSVVHTQLAASQATLAVQSPAEQLQTQVQPYLTQFLKLNEELNTLGAKHKMSLSISPKILNSTPPLATVVLNSSSYLGGAHGASAQNYYNFDLEKQKVMNLKDIVLNKQYPALNKLAYAAFQSWIKDNNLANSVQDYEQTWSFKMTNNFYLGKQGLILQYAEYEIGPYVVGLPRLVLPYAQLKGILKEQYIPAEANLNASSAVQPE
ncbi:RsiV family protein [Acinetobacter larvae]|uniref:DUF3298 domain-containing protein n=1 Tax=Acinetobacter larvae TaxID=1789224 RepID=A0A1B2M2A4_9GAMM|nr:RsiV family protein [Acinetobacter larvae]AOA59318.1 hypothetical protein BFG52_13770 [Acinetobacter larvae]